MQDQNTTETVESVTQEFIQSVEQEPATVLVHISAPDLTIPEEVDPDLHKEAEQAAQEASEQEEKACTEDDPRREVDQSENPLSAEEINEELRMQRAHLAECLGKAYDHIKKQELEMAELKAKLVSTILPTGTKVTLPHNEAFDIEEAIDDSDAPASEGSKALSDDEAMDEMAAPGAKLDLNADFVESLEELVAAVDAGSMLDVSAKDLVIPAAILMLCREVRDVKNALTEVNDTLTEMNVSEYGDEDLDDEDF
jgi:hypothetical protein